MNATPTPPPFRIGVPRRVAVPLLGIVLLLGIVFRLDDLAARGMGHAEIFVPGIDLPRALSVPLPRLTLWETVLGAIREPHPPAWYVAMWPWTWLLGTDLFLIRLPSVLFGAASIPLAYGLARLEGERLTALLAAGLLAFNGQHIFWSQVARPFAMACFLGLASTLLLLLVLRGGQRQRLFLALYVTASLAGLATLYYFWPIFLTHTLWVLWNTWTGRASTPGVLRSQLFILLLGSLAIPLAIIQSRPSYLSRGLLEVVGEFLQFGSLFQVDRDALVPAPLPTGAAAVLLVLAGLLLVAGLRVNRSHAPGWTAADVAGPSPRHLGLTAALACLAILAVATVFHGSVPRLMAQDADLAAFFHGSVSRKATLLFASALVPLLAFLLAALLERQLARRRPPGVLAPEAPARSAGPCTLVSFLAVTPVLMIAGVSLVVPSAAARHMLLFTPYLLIVLARGAAAVARFSPVLFVALAVFLAAIHGLSIAYNKHRPGSPIDYKGLAQRWIPHIQARDVILVRRHWVTTPIFYYLRGDRYQFAEWHTPRAVQNLRGSRVWVLSFPGLALPEELRDTLAGYQPSVKVEARRVKAELYVPPPAHSRPPEAFPPTPAARR